ncbi:MAG: hypothetical protein FJX65_08310 [Alphaproteobacteria bacterium]|nr:hypothetical protein [Alphaproteobacteria bacterium]
MAGSDDWLRAMPKVELHCHLIGAMRASTWRELAHKNGIALPADPELIYANMNSRPADPAAYAHAVVSMAPDPDEVYPDPSFSLLTIYDTAARSVVTDDDFVRLGYEIAEDAARESNVRYLELFYDPTTFFPQGVSFATITDGLIEGFRAAERAYGIRSRLIAAINRAESAALARELLEIVIAERRDEILGIGLDNLETAGPPEKFAEAFAMARRAGLKRTAHTAEHDPHARNIVTCLDVLACDRLDHGYFILHDPAVVARCRDAGIHFTCSFTTSRRSWRAWRRRSIKAMHEAGLRLVLGADDPTMFPTTLAREFAIGRDKVGFSDQTLTQIALNGIDASWLDPGEKQSLRREFTREIARSRATKETV